MSSLADKDQLGRIIFASHLATFVNGCCMLVEPEVVEAAACQPCPWGEIDKYILSPDTYL